MIKAVFLDIDGTLVSFKTHRVPESALEAVHRVREHGVKVFIATGRPLPFVDNLGELEYDGILCVNGACCIEIKNTDKTFSEDMVFFKKPLPQEDLERLIEDSKTHPIPITFANNTGAVSCNVSSAQKEFDEIFRLIDLPFTERVDIEEIRGKEIMQAVAFFTKEDEERMKRDIIPGCTVTRWHPYFADCIAKGTNKAVGIGEFCRHYGFDISETMAFGDGGNDIEMLRHVGVGVAMGNASDEVKAIADVVTTSVDDDGVARVLSQWL